MVQSGFARVVGFAAFFRHNCIGGTGEHEGNGKILIPENRIGFLGEKIVPGDVDEERFCPKCLGKFAFRSGNGIDSGGVQDEVEASELQNCGLESVGDTACGAEVHVNG